MQASYADRGDYYVLDKRLGPVRRRDTHRHAVATLTLVFEGRLREGFPDGPRDCPRWSVLFKPAGIPHTTESGVDGVRMIVVGLAAATVGQHGLGRVRAAAQLDAGVPVYLALALMDRTLRGATVDASPLLERLLATTADRCRLDTDDALAPPWLRRARVLLADNPLAPRAAVARRVGVHPVSLTRAFTRHYGCSPTAYRRRRRADAAVARLLVGSDSPAAIAHDLGYHDQSHLTHDVRRAAGVSPGRLRTAVQGLAVRRTRAQ